MAMLAFESAKARLSEVQSPESYEEAIQPVDRIEWEKSMKDEYDSLVENHTWILVPEDELPSGQHTLDGKQVYRIKKIMKPEKSPQLRYKARWVVKRCQQKHSLDDFEIFAQLQNQLKFHILVTDSGLPMN